MADTKISALTAVSAVIAADEFAVNDAGTSKKASAAQVRDFMAIRPYATGSLTIPTGFYMLMADRLELTGTQEVELQGDSTLVIL